MKKFLLILISLVSIVCCYFVFFSVKFEKVPPKIIVSKSQYWNPKNDYIIQLEDNYGLKNFKIFIGYKEILNYKFSQPTKNYKINLKSSEIKRYIINKNNVLLKIIVNDISKWDFFTGNTTTKEIKLTIDKKYPNVSIIAHSYGIGKGGSALVIAKVEDKNLKDTFIKVNNKYTFKLFPFRKKTYYAALIAWPIIEKHFDASIIAKDLANNKTEIEIPFFHKKYRYKKDKIILNEKIIKKLTKVLEQSGLPIPQEPVSAFKQINEKLREISEKQIAKASTNFKIEQINDFKISKFYPLKGAANRSQYGEHRFYYLNGEKISESYHLGIDLASFKHSKIILSNPGKVLYANFTGIYGNTLIIYHGLGLSSLYAHCSSFKVSEGQSVKKGSVIALTGSTGAVFGDHLHFGILVQGIEVQPLEWMDNHWIKVNITNLIEEAKALIK